MTALQKQAWYCLAVIAATCVALAALYPVLGSKASVAFSILALIAFSVFFYSKRGKRIVWDERDTLIQRRANTLAYTVLWLAFVTAALLAPTYYGRDVPTAAVQNSVWVAFMILYAVQSIAVLAQYRSGAIHAE